MLRRASGHVRYWRARPKPLREGCVSMAYSGPQRCRAGCTPCHLPGQVHGYPRSSTVKSTRAIRDDFTQAARTITRGSLRHQRRPYPMIESGRVSWLDQRSGAAAVRDRVRITAVPAVVTAGRPGKRRQALTARYVATVAPRPASSALMEELASRRRQRRIQRHRL